MFEKYSVKILEDTKDDDLFKRADTLNEPFKKSLTAFFDEIANEPVQELLVQTKINESEESGEEKVQKDKNIEEKQKQENVSEKLG